MISQPTSDDAGAPPLPTGVRAAAAWMLLAALAQLAYLAHWPLYVAGRPVGDWGTLGVALGRMGLYAGLGLGLFRRDATAWAGTVLEMGRSVLLFLVPAWGADRQLIGVLFPGSWAQGALTGCLPFVILANGAMAAGWNPGSRLEFHAAIAVRVAAALLALGALGLRRRCPVFGLSEAESGPALWRRGLPVVLAVSFLEVAALLLGR